MVCILSIASAGAAHADNSSAWTQEQVKTLCHARADNSNNSRAFYDRCIKHRMRLVGKAKQPGEAGELNRADKKNAAKNHPRK